MDKCNAKSECDREPTACEVVALIRKLPTSELVALMNLLPDLSTNLCPEHGVVSRKEAMKSKSGRTVNPTRLHLLAMAVVLHDYFDTKWEQVRELINPLYNKHLNAEFANTKYLESSVSRVKKHHSCDLERAVRWAITTIYFPKSDRS